MMRQLQHSPVLGERLLCGMSLAFAGHDQRPKASRRSFVVAPAVVRFPRRPDASVVNEAIPLFYIGRNKNGAWVVRESEGRSGGLFLLKQSAVRFARRQSEPAGCALMFLAESIELDVENKGSRYAGPVSAIDNAARRASFSASILRTLVAACRRFGANVPRRLAGKRRNRDAIERELFRGQYTLGSKNDDDLPVVR
jgi:hypothetical protein